MTEQVMNLEKTSALDNHLRRYPGNVPGLTLSSNIEETCPGSLELVLTGHGCRSAKPSIRDGIEVEEEKVHAAKSVGNLGISS